MVFENLVSPEESDSLSLEQEVNLMKSLKILLHFDRDHSHSLGIAEDLAAHTEECHGSDSQIFLSVMSDLGSSYMNANEVAKAEELFSRTLVKLRRAKSANVKEVADLLRHIALCKPRTELSKAMTSVARALEQKFGIKSAEDVAMQMLFTVMGRQPEPDMVAEEANKHLEDWFTEEEQKTDVPFVQIEISREERLRKLMPLLERAQIAADIVEATDSHPLCRISILAQMSEVLLELGEVERAKKLRQEQIVILKKHWGDEHAMTKEANAELEKLA